MLLFIEDLGLWLIRLFDYIGGIFILFFETCSNIFKGKIKWNLTLDQMAILGVNSLSIVVLTAAFAGMVISLEIAHLAVRYGVGTMVGGGVAMAMGRELGPMLTSIVFAGRAGSAITAELGSMKVTEQIDALKAMAVSPVKQLVVPRFIACLAMLPVLTLFANLFGVVGGALIAKQIANIQFQAFFDSIRALLDMSDLWGGMYKAIVFAAEIALISCFQGLNTSGGAAGVGKATTGSVVYSMILIFITNYFMSAWLFK